MDENCDEISFREVTLGKDNIPVEGFFIIPIYLFAKEVERTKVELGLEVAVLPSLEAGNEIRPMAITRIIGGFGLPH